MVLRLRITPRAKRDIAEIRAYILEHDKQGAERVRQRIVRAMDLLIDHPMIGPQSDEPGVRVRLVTPYPYRVYYRIKPDAVEILHVCHTARREPDPSEVI